MKTSILLPLFPGQTPSARLLKFLARERGEVLFLSGNEETHPPALENLLKKGGARLIRGTRRGMAELLNRGVAESSGELLLFLDPRAEPSAGWKGAMEKGSQEGDILVGETRSLRSSRPGAYEKLALRLFQGHSRRTAWAKGHALPWGPVCNLGIKREWLEKAGPFSPEAGGACDIDWCWRAVLQGARVSYREKALIDLPRSSERNALLREFDLYGQGEAWLHRTYSFLLDEEEKRDPLLEGVDAATRLLRHSQAAKAAALAGPLSEVAGAFGSGLRLAYELPHRACPLERELPGHAISWESGRGETTVFVPGRGLASLKGKMRELWLAFAAGADTDSLEKMFRKFFQAKPEEARMAVEDFIGSLDPGSSHGHHHRH